MPSLTRALTLAFTLSLVLPAGAGANNFGRLFPDLPPLNGHTDQQLADLAQGMLDPNADAENSCRVTVPLATEGCTFSLMTYGGGQFVDHDVTLDLTPSPTGPVDPTLIPNSRTPVLDLDSVYAGGPGVSPQLYDGDRFLVQTPNLNGVRDLPRRPDGTAILVEARNDENQVLSQIHTAFLLFHNRLVDEGLSFEQAQRFLISHYQRIVVEDVLQNSQLSRSLGDIEKNDQVKDLAKRIKQGDFTPVEFSVAAFRDGHSKVRRAYRLNSTNGCANLQVFNFANMDAALVGGRPLQAGRQIDWGMFTDTLPKPAGCELVDRNIQRKTDTLISSSLFQLPIPGAAAEGSNVLAFRNLVRSKHYGLPSGEAVAASLGQPVLTPAELALPASVAPAFASGTPLWFYLLRESAAREGGLRLGPTGSLIVAATFLTMADSDVLSFKPDERVVGEDGRLTFSDIFSFARTER